jgi:hypothetical protein
MQISERTLYIMTKHPGLQLNLHRKSLLLAAAWIAIAAPVTLAQTAAPPAASAQPVPAQGGTAAHGDKFGAESVKKDFKFEVVSIRPVSPQSTAERPGPTPDGFDAQIPLYNMIMLAYAPEEFLAFLRLNSDPLGSSNPPQSSLGPLRDQRTRRGRATAKPGAIKAIAMNFSAPPCGRSSKSASNSSSTEHPGEFLGTTFGHDGEGRETESDSSGVRASTWPSAQKWRSRGQ